MTRRENREGDFPDTAPYQGWKYCQGNVSLVDDALTVEEALQITINNTPFTMTMRTPGSERELVRGLLFSENVYSELEPDPPTLVSATNDAGVITSIWVTIPPDKLGKGAQVKRNILSVSSCGICGKAELDLIGNGKPRLGQEERLESERVQPMIEKMSSAQSTFKRSGGSHAAAAFALGGEMLTIQEDIGRHNAVDKVIGSLLLHRQLHQARCLVASGRISYEIVNKCFAAGIPFLAGVSAPSSLAVDLAERFGITLLAFCRGAQFTVYSHPAKIKT